MKNIKDNIFFKEVNTETKDSDIIIKEIQELKGEGIISIMKERLLKSPAFIKWCKNGGELPVRVENELYRLKINPYNTKMVEMSCLEKGVIIMNNILSLEKQVRSMISYYTYSLSEIWENIYEFVGEKENHDISTEEKSKILKIRNEIKEWENLLYELPSEVIREVKKMK